MELNPEHPVTRELHDQWFKLLALVMHKQGLTSVDILVEDITALNYKYNNEPAVIAHGKSDRITLTLTTITEANKKARQ